MTRPYEGRVDNVASYGRALTSREISELSRLRRVWVAVRKNRTPFAVGESRQECRRLAGYRNDLSYEEWWERLEETESGLRFWNVSDALQRELASKDTP